MNITKEQADKVIAALSMNRIMARDENGNYTKEITAQVVVEALSIMRGLADSEPVADRSPEHCERFPFCGCFSGCDDDDTSPQAVQTEAQEREAFEAWIAKDCGDLKTFGEGSNKHYLNMAVNHEWIGWMKRAGRKG